MRRPELEKLWCAVWRLLLALEPGATVVAAPLLGQEGVRGLGFAGGTSLPSLFPLMPLHKVFHNFLKKQKHNPA